MRDVPWSDARMVLYTVYLEPSQYERLKELSTVTRVSLSAYAREAIDLVLSRYPEPKREEVMGDDIDKHGEREAFEAGVRAALRVLSDDVLVDLWGLIGTGGCPRCRCKWTHAMLRHVYFDSCMTLNVTCPGCERPVALYCQWVVEP